jgi:hypothetical protein
MISYAWAKDYLRTYLEGIGYDPLPTFVPGIGDPDVLDTAPERLVVLTVGSGAGLSVEYAFDRPSLQVRTAGRQNNYEDGEQLAFDCDRGLLTIDHSQRVGGVWILAVVRFGGSPSFLIKDDGDRYHFTCNYIVEAETGW